MKPTKKPAKSKLMGVLALVTRRGVDVLSARESDFVWDAVVEFEERLIANGECCEGAATAHTKECRAKIGRQLRRRIK
ncbi:MAG: hypothetical protein Q7S02_00625 [bacterium]|nr:hypothetical protein [bacterium]